MSFGVNEDAQPVTKVTQLLARLGYADERPGNTVELAIDRFDQWTNPRGAMLTPSTDCIVGASFALERAA
ncbi:MAG TPA: hypothetical protein VGX25_13555 [Actinophytocola sp.]|uniref:hypothetical protein n=1 Tax=Actinophytocola sp. TaxID=1872138 RepID=UPI002DDCA4F5|nr:hypothetical protein [Actinophytocola sp.]HEV2780410.1 hypothetical protein [Actinophytocola sp.]